MSSSSSTEQLYDYYNYGATYYENNFSTYNAAPVYPAMNPLLVYTANVPMGYHPRCRENSDNANCFVKAFRWYTQEHLPRKGGPSNKQSTTGFASWLDSKYDEYLESQDKNNYFVSMKQTSIIAAAGQIPNNTCDESCGNVKEKKKRRLKKLNSWKKKRHHSKEDEHYSSDKGSNSLSYILQPKELTQPNSDYIQASMTEISSHDVEKKYAYKSQSCTQMCQKDSQKIDIITTQEGLSTEKVKKDNGDKKIMLRDDFCQYSCSRLERKDVQVQCTTENERISSSFKVTVAQRSCLQDKETMPAPLKVTDHVCQCFQYVQKKDVSTQMDRDNKERKSCEVEKRDSLNRCQCPTSVGPPCHIQPAQIVQTKSAKTSHLSQTSDYAIKLEESNNCEYQFFMKVVCADKLSKEN